MIIITFDSILMINKKLISNQISFFISFMSCRRVYYSREIGLLKGNYRY